MTVNFFLLYISAVFLASIIPGPSMLLALSHGMKYGVRSSMVTALGNMTASLLQATAAVAGMGTILRLSEDVFWAVKLLGAAYLIYIGIVTWRAAEPKIEVGSNSTQIRPPLRRMFCQAFLVAGGNPKAIIFFTALFPQFINPDADMKIQYALLLGGLAPVAFICFMLYALGGEKLISIISSRNLLRRCNKAIGGTFISAGIGLAFSRR